MGAKRVVVIGEGLAGVAAAAFAQNAGASVTIVAAGPGGSAFSSGAIDLAGDPVAPAERPDAVCVDVAKNLEQVMLRRPGHPYAILAGQAEESVGDLLALLREALDCLFPAGGLVELEGDPARNQPCFTALGTIKFTALAPTSIARPDRTDLERPLALGVMGLADFEPAMWAKVARENASRLGLEIAPAPGWLRFQNEFERQAPELAKAIARDPDAFARAVKDAAANAKEMTAVVLPAILPAAGRADLIRNVSAAVGKPVHEVLSLPPSIPGLRQSQHLVARARELGMDSIRGEVVGFSADGGRVKSLTVKDAEGEHVFDADAFVLATGKFMSGGLNKGAAFGETVFGLPVFVNGRAPGAIFIEKTIGLHVNERHALFEAGVKVDEMLRPHDLDGDPAYENLFAAGAVLAGHNYVADGTGSGVALATGARAGANAAALLRE